MRRRRCLAGVVLLAVLLAACGQPVATSTVTPKVGQAGMVTATVGASPTRPGTPGTPVAATPGTATRVVPPTGVVVSPTAVRPTVAMDPALRAALAALPEAREIAIEDDLGVWTSFTEAHYLLTRRGDEFVGPARVVASTVNGTTQASMAEVTVPADAARAFLALLAQTPLRANTSSVVYMSDYSASKLIALETPAGRIQFTMTTNSADGLPWRVATETAEYETYDDTPRRALKLLDLSLERGTGIVTSPAGREPLFCRTPAVPGDPLGRRVVRQEDGAVNLAQEYGLLRLTSVEFVDDGRRSEWRDAQQIAALVAVFDQPVARIEPTSWSSQDLVVLFLYFRPFDYISVEYNPSLEVIRWQRDTTLRKPSIQTVAPPGLRELVLGEVCGR